MQFGIHASYYFKAMLNKHLTKILSTLAIIYIFSMGIWPLLVSKGSWNYILDVWHRWQGFNVGVLALLTSLMAFKITKYREEQQRKRDFIAERAFLPQVLSELCEYLKSSAKVYVEAFEKVTERGRDDCNVPLENALPILSSEYKEVFRECIRVAEPNVAKYLANILVELQVHNSVMTDLYNEFSPEKRMKNEAVQIKSYIISLGAIQALVNHAFGFARGTESFNFRGLTWENLRNAYGNLEVQYEDIDELESWTKRRLDRQ